MDPMLIVTLAAVALASTMSLVAWRVVREDRRRSEARVAALAADVHGSAAGNHLQLRDEATDPLAFFAGAEPHPPTKHPAALIGASALVVVGVATMFMVVTRIAAPVDPQRSSAELAQATTPSPVAVAEPRALELVALGHDRDGDGLTVRGSVRNPDNALPGRLTAVVLVFNTEGGFLTSGRADVNTRGLSPGTEAPFEVAIPAAAEVGRYRVSFRSVDRVVPHVDRRR